MCVLNRFKGRFIIENQYYKWENLTTTHSQVISRTLSLGVRWSRNFILDPYGISVFLTYYKSLDLEVNGGGLEQEDVAEEPVKQQ